MSAPPPTQRGQGIDYAHGDDVQTLHADIELGGHDRQVTIKPFPLSALVVCGLAIFLAGFWSARYSATNTGAILDSVNPTQAGNGQAVQANALSVRSAPANATAAAVVHVLIKNMKFDPPTLEVKAGDTIEWTNDDITPHTATSAAFDSGSIDSGKSWRHTFTQSGNFNYACTFHPEMKGAVTVK